MTNKFSILEAEIGQRLDKVLTQRFPATTRSQWQKLIKQGLILVNNIIVTPHHFLRIGSEISLLPAKPLTPPKKITTKKLVALIPEIIFENKDYLIINKPSGLLVHPTTRKEKNTLVAWLKKKYPKATKTFLASRRLDSEEKKRPGIVHRLDAEVSGLMVIAKTIEMYHSLKEQFANRQINKNYLALVYGVITKDEDIIALAIGRSTSQGRMAAHTQTADKDREAKTEYWVLKRFINNTLLKVKIYTGRTHQIRAHLQAIGYPIVGDPLYRPKKDTFHDSRKKIKIKNDLMRPFLHSTTLGFSDLAGHWQEYNNNLPPELADYLKKLR
ncbi:MAG: RluA family pseudouridine synthase [Candidatus Buchananbacteria bacterium]